MLLWLAHLEETLPRDVDRAIRAAAPPPILAIPVRSHAATLSVLVPEQRPVPMPVAPIAVELSA
jgi:phosphoribosylcarboxyaminoimidazole (NCAIR) mutase